MTAIYLLTEEREHRGVPYDKAIAAVSTEAAAKEWVAAKPDSEWRRDYEEIELYRPGAKP